LTQASSRIVGSLAEIAGDYPAAFVDLWGCVHNGVRAHEAACEALIAYRQRGGRVVLVTNSPRPRASVEVQISGMGVPREAWDSIATSGDAARVSLFQGEIGSRVWFMGQPHETSFFDPPRILEHPISIERVPLVEAEGIACCGPFDAKADPEVNRPDFEAAIACGLPLLCANPDIIVDRGESREWCAGALAALYESMGGRSLYFGKPHAPIYDLARMRLEEIGGEATAPILCIGDGPGTDVEGAARQGLDCLFVSGGLAAAETSTAPGGQPEEEPLAAYLAQQELSPRYSIGFLR
jgi:HAD superfamily hydrolase (TIGR01459 family)